MASLQLCCLPQTSRPSNPFPAHAFQHVEKGLCNPQLCRTLDCYLPLATQQHVDMHWQHTAGLTSSLLEPHRAPADAHTPQAELRLPGGSPRARSSDAQQASQPASCQACSGSSQPEQHRDPPECRASATAAAVPNTDMVRDTESQPTSEAADAACGARGSAAASPASEIGRPSHLVPPSVPQLSNSHAARQGPSDPAQQGPTDPMQEGPTGPALTCSPAACTRAGSRGLSQVGVGCHSC